MYSADSNYFGDVLLVLDGDVKDERIDKLPQFSKLKNIIKLPGGLRPEELIYNYVYSLESNHLFWEKTGIYSITWQFINDNSQESQKYKGIAKEREKYKQWFNENKWWIDALNIFDLWAIDHKELVDAFINDIINAYNSIANRNFYPSILRNY